MIPDAATALQLDRAAVAQSELWRLFTAHLTHFDTNHLQWDVLALLLLGTMAERGHRRALPLTLGLAAPAISIAVLALQPEFQTYRGLSGLDSALFGIVVVRQFVAGWQARHPVSLAIGALASLGFIAKTTFELTTGDTVFASAQNYTPVPLAHLVGFAIGAGMAVFNARRIQNRTTASAPAATVTVSTLSP